MLDIRAFGAYRLTDGTRLKTTPRIISTSPFDSVCQLEFGGTETTFAQYRVSNCTWTSEQSPLLSLLLSPLAEPHPPSSLPRPPPPPPLPPHPSTTSSSTSSTSSTSYLLPVSLVLRLLRLMDQSLVVSQCRFHFYHLHLHHLRHLSVHTRVALLQCWHGER